MVESEGYSGIVSSHSWADEPSIGRIYDLGGVVTPYAGGSAGSAEGWPADKARADPQRFYFGYGYGADMNGFGSQGGPRGAGVPNPVTYPFTGFGGVTVDRQESGERVYDLNVDGVAHYGLYPDWVEDVRILGGNDLLRDMTRGPEAYLQMWERAQGIAPNACVDGGLDRRDFRFLRRNMTTKQVLETLGQPQSRIDRLYRYCVKSGSGTSGAAVRFDRAGRFIQVTFTARPPEA